ncbi:MAG: hypothetical protein J07HQW2_00157 [Haloquadratum walsbyi J07HQW2]|uniref:ScoMcrA-like SRA domain-containing protein n=1 Tax=Haloquadratum walsbyi J07HQW2 TaxID=1238425 RepID=U1MTV2_9EURY|nr:MAG: hypothetical protein J07HQW2_00157 [Haloquadratum walsbyi J07HQW2]
MILDSFFVHDCSQKTQDQSGRLYLPSWTASILKSDSYGSSNRLLGFGYHISGINPRRNHNDDRYILVFANEDGPYDDSVTDGQFRYIGEGLEGNQSEKSSGNSALIDAISTDIPTYFFYSEADQSEAN